MLERCQKYHVVGQVQPASAVVVFDLSSEKIVGASENFGTFHDNGSLEFVVGRTGLEVLGRTAIHDLRNAATIDTFERCPEFLGTWDLGNAPLDVTAYRSGGLVIVEIMAARSQVSSLVLVKDIARMNDRISSGSDLVEMLSAVARPLRILSGFDRLQVLSAEGHGTFKVLAESTRSAMVETVGEVMQSSFLGSDAPFPPMQLISDSKATPVNILSLNDDPLDLRLAKSAFPRTERLAQLDELGMRSDMVQPIVINGKLWGALLFQNRRPRVPSLRFTMVSSSIMSLFAATISQLS